MSYLKTTAYTNVRTRCAMTSSAIMDYRNEHDDEDEDRTRHSGDTAIIVCARCMLVLSCKSRPPLERTSGSSIPRPGGWPAPTCCLGFRDCVINIQIVLTRKSSRAFWLSAPKPHTLAGWVPWQRFPVQTPARLHYGSSWRGPSSSHLR